MKTFIKWQGNKSRYIKHIVPFFPKEFDTYIEPFIGSGALFLHTQPKKWIINDLNRDLINVWENVRASPTNILTHFKKFDREFTPLSIKGKKEMCQQITKMISTLPYEVFRASIFVLMIYCVFMGHILNKNNFSFASLDLNIYAGRKPFCLSHKYSVNLAHVHRYLDTSDGLISNKDYRVILKSAHKHDFVVLDPPYIESHDYQFNYNKDERIDETFVHELYDEVKKLDMRGVKWIMTQADTKCIRKIFKEYKISSYKIYRRQSKTYKKELIIKNY